jgi:uncharacterized protein YndB with AHSA1/START domain
MPKDATPTMTVVDRVMAGDAHQVWDVLSDGWLFPVWVVGATHMRDVDDTWPAPGAQLHHEVGAWPMSLSDTTQVIESDPGRRLVLRARAWPVGEAVIEITVEPHPDGASVQLAEGTSRGPAYLFDNPLQRKILKARNVETLRRLAAIVENRKQPSYQR